MKSFILSALLLSQSGYARDRLWFTTLQFDDGLAIEYRTEKNRTEALCQKKKPGCTAEKLTPKRWKLADTRATAEGTAAYTGKLEAILKASASGTLGLALSVTHYASKKETPWREDIGDWSKGFVAYVADSRREWIQLPEWLAPEPIWIKLSPDTLRGKTEAAEGKLVEFTASLKATHRKTGKAFLLPRGLYFFLMQRAGKAEVRAGLKRDLCGGPAEPLTKGLPEGEFEMDLDSLFPDGIVRFTPLSPGRGC